jgi:hypothetical protein
MGFFDLIGAVFLVAFIAERRANAPESGCIDMKTLKNWTLTPVGKPSGTAGRWPAPPVPVCAGREPVPRAA